MPYIEPLTVIDSRITTLFNRFSSSWVDQDDPSKITYKWSFDAPLGLVELEDAKNSEHTSSNSIVVVSGTLTIRERLNFELNQESNLTEANGTRTLNSLQEKATGRSVASRGDSLLLHARTACAAGIFTGKHHCDHRWS